MIPELARKQMAAGRGYEDAHPEVDWDNNIVILARTDDGGWIATGHEYFSAEDKERAFGCCSPGQCPMHDGSNVDVSVPVETSTGGTP